MGKGELVLKSGLYEEVINKNLSGELANEEDKLSKIVPIDNA
jgi:hypothetical protein